jgi:hypothetical protein
VTGKAKAPGLPRRMTRLLIGSSGLRRPSDRIEGALVALLSAAFLACAAAAALFGLRLCQIHSDEAAHLHPAVAVVSSVSEPGFMFAATEVTARWRAPDGQQRSGVLTTATAPGISAAQAGTRVRIWLTASGDPASPPNAVGTAVTAALLATATWAGAGIVLGACYLVVRAVLDRRRLAGWESDWALTGPRWSTRR